MLNYSLLFNWMNLHTVIALLPTFTLECITLLSLTFKSLSTLKMKMMLEDEVPISVIAFSLKQNRF